MVKILPEPPVNSNSRRPGRLANPGQFGGDFFAPPPPGPHLYSYRPPGGLHHSGHNRRRTGEVFQQRRPFPVSDHLGNGTAHIDIQKRKWKITKNPGRPGHGLWVGTKKLHADRGFSGFSTQEFPGTPVSMDQGFVTDHLSKNQAAAEGFKNSPEREVSHSGHGGQDYRVFQFYRAYLQYAHPSRGAATAK